MLFKKDELKNLWPFYLYLLVYGLSTMIYPFTIVHFMNIGLTFFQISVITAVNGLLMVLFEIPTGAFADGVSRKYSMVLGFSIVALAAILIGFTSNFYLITILWGI